METSELIDRMMDDFKEKTFAKIDATFAQIKRNYTIACIGFLFLGFVVGLVAGISIR